MHYLYALFAPVTWLMNDFNTYTNTKGSNIVGQSHCMRTSVWLMTRCECIIQSVGRSSYIVDIQITQPVGIGDSLHNISLVRAFCDSHLPVRIFTFTYEDLLYSTDTIKPSLLAFLTQLLYYFVIKPLDIVSLPPPTSTSHNQGELLLLLHPKFLPWFVRGAKFLLSLLLCSYSKFTRDKPCALLDFSVS